MTIDGAIQKMREEAKRQRYNASFDKGGIYHQLCLCALQNAQEYDQMAEMLERFKEYQQLEEQGRLVKLPCKVGDKLYYTDSYCNTVISVRLNEVIAQFVGINNYAYQYNCCSFDECGDVYEEYEFDNNDFGKTVFLTKSEAEVRLEELRGENKGKV